MNINRDNYEEYFLMYADNELSDSQKTSVLLFLKENKDLEGEFRMILHTISAPDPGVELTDKSFLYRQESASGINLDNYEEFFILYHDGELSEIQETATLSFLEKNPSLKASFDLVGTARLRPDETVVFADRKILYRYQKSGRVIKPLFWSMLSAAAVAGFGWWVLATYTERPVNTHPAGFQVSRTTLAPKGMKDAADSQQKAPEVTPSAGTGGPRSKGAITAAGPIKASLADRILKKDEGGASGNPENTTTTPLKDLTGIAATQTGRNSPDLPIGGDTKITTDQIAALKTVAPSENFTAAIQKNPETGSPAATRAQASSSLQNETAGNQDYVFYDVSESDFRKTRMGGFFKKVKRIISRNNPINRIFEGSETTLR